MDSLTHYYFYKNATKDPRQMNPSELQDYIRSSGVTVKGNDRTAIPLSNVRQLNEDDSLQVGDYGIVD